MKKKSFKQLLKGAEHAVHGLHRSRDQLQREQPLKGEAHLMARIRMLRGVLAQIATGKRNTMDRRLAISCLTFDEELQKERQRKVIK